MFAFHISIQILYQCLPTIEFQKGQNEKKKRAYTHLIYMTNWKQNDKANSILCIQSTFYEGYQKIRKKPLWKTIQYVPNFAVFFHQPSLSMCNGVSLSNPTKPVERIARSGTFLP